MKISITGKVRCTPSRLCFDIESGSIITFVLGGHVENDHYQSSISPYLSAKSCPRKTLNNLFQALSRQECGNGLEKTPPTPSSSTPLLQTEKRLLKTGKIRHKEKCMMPVEVNAQRGSCAVAT